MKKLISLLIAVCLILSSALIVNAGIDDLPEGFYMDFTAVSGGASGAVTETNYKNVYELIKYMGLMNNDALNAGDKATRGMTAQIFAGIAGGVVGEVKEKPFSDVKVEDEYAGGIATALSMGIIDGGSKFFPKDGITPADAASIALRTLGYIGNLQENYPLSKAITLRLFTGIDTSKDTLTVGDVILLAVNTMETARVEKESISSNGSYTINKSRASYFEEKGIALVEGIVTAAGMFSLYETGGNLPANHVEINRKKFNSDSAIPDTLFGKAVMAYVDEENDEKLITIWENKVNTVAVTLGNGDITGKTVNNITYLDEELKKVNMPVSSSAKVVYNLDYYGIMSKAIADGIFDTADEIVIIDNNGDEEADVIHAKNYEYVCIEKVMTASEMASLKYGKGTFYAKKDNENLVMKKGNGVITIDDLNQNNVLKILSSGSGETFRQYVTVSTEMVAAELESVADNGGNSVFVLDGEEYELSDEYAYYYKNNTDRNNPIPEIGKTSTFFMADDGKIAGSSTSAVFTYGYLMAAAMEGGLSDKCQLKIIDMRKSKKVYDLADRVKLYVPPARENDPIEIIGSASPEQVYNALKPNGVFSTDMVAFTVNADGQINTIAPEWVHYTAKPIETDYPLVKGWATGETELGSANAWLYMQIMNNLYNCEPTSFIRVPLTDDNATRADDVYYGRYDPGNNTTYGADNKTDDSLHLYNISKTYSVPIAIYKAPARALSDTMGAYTRPVIITGLKYELNSDDEPAVILEFLSSNAKEKAEMNTECKFSYEDPTSPGYYGKPASPFDLKPGDIVQLRKDSLSKVDLVRVLFRESDRGNYRTQDGTTVVSEPTTTGRSWSDLNVVYGKVLENENGALLISQSEDDNPDKIYPFFFSDVRRSEHGNAAVFLYDSEEQTAVETNINNVVPGDIVVMRGDGNIIVDVYIYR